MYIPVPIKSTRPNPDFIKAAEERRISTEEADRYKSLFEEEFAEAKTKSKKRGLVLLVCFVITAMGWIAKIIFFAIVGGLSCFILLFICMPALEKLNLYYFLLKALKKGYPELFLGNEKSC